MKRIEVDFSGRGEGNAVHIAPFNDIHYNTEECDKERFLRYIAWGAKEIKKGNHLVGIGLGDYNDILSPSERATFHSAKGGYGLHETSLQQFDIWLDGITQTFAGAMQPWIGHIRMLLQGHHHMCYSAVAKGPLRRFRGWSNTEHLCELLDCTFGGQLGVVDLTFGHNLRLTVVATHGYGGARTAGARVTKRIRMNEVYTIPPGASGILYLMAHDNTKMAISDNVLTHENGKYVARKRTYCGTGSFQRAYPDNEPNGGYVEEIMLPPSDLGAVITTVRKEKRNGRWRLDWHTSV
jgi:hypothetical protein